MRKEEFLKELSYLLQDIPDADREEALKYYEEYFEDAPEGEEDEIIRKLGSPEKVAATIREGLRSDEESEAFGEYTDAGYMDERFEDHRMPETYSSGREEDRERHQGTYQEKHYGEYRGEKTGGEQRDRTREQDREWEQPTKDGASEQPREKKRGGCLKIFLIIALCICAVPILIPLALVAALAVLGAVLAVLAAAAAFLLGGGALFAAGIWAVGKGIGVLFVAPATGLMICGLSLVGIAAGILICCFIVWLLCKAVPPLANGLVRIVRRPFEKGGTKP